MKSAPDVASPGAGSDAPRLALVPRWVWRLGIGALIVGLLYFSLRDANLLGILSALSRLRPWQLVVILAVDATIYALMGARWWLIVRAENRAVSVLELIAVRLSAFGISYFTLGPQVGGEPLQVLFLRRRYGTAFARAGASVALDKLLELLANYVFLILGVGALMRAGVVRAAGPSVTFALAGAAVLAAWPLLHILLLRRNVLPVSAALKVIPGLRPPGNALRRHVRASEKLVARFCQRRPRLLSAVLGISLLASLLAVIEYALVTSFLHVVLTPWQTMSAWTAGWLSFLVPVPAGLGALEASQVVALGAFGATAEAAIGVSLLMRGRDILLGGTGLLFGLRRWQPRKSKAD